MERYSIFDGGATAPARGLAQPSADEEPAVPSPAPEPASRKVVFPGEDGGRSLNQMAERDLDAMLQLLAERAQYITGATGAAIALRDGEEIVCRASAGSVAPEIGAHLAVDTGLSGESIRTRQILRCDDATTDARVNRESCEALGIASVVVMPLVRDEDVNGVFELLSDRPSAFEERDIAALERLGEMVQTALDHVAAARRTAELESAAASLPPKPAAPTVRPPSGRPPSALAKDLFEDPVVPDQATASEPFGASFEGSARESILQAEPKLEDDAITHPAIESKAEAVEAGEIVAGPVSPEVQAQAIEVAQGPRLEPGEEPEAIIAEEPVAAAPAVAGKASLLKKCVTCGFPVSEGRTLCLDCEKKAKASGEPAPVAALPVSEGATPLFTMGAEGQEEGSFFARHRVLVVIIVVVGAIAAALVVLR